MKRIEELGISPHPWDRHIQFVIAKDDRSIVAASNLRDASLIAAAPEIYEALRKLISVARNRLPSQPTLDEIEVLQMAESAIAKASGEEAK